MRAPVAYDRRLAIEQPKVYAAVKQRRIESGTEFADNNTHKRLLVRERVQVARFKQLIRSLEGDDEAL